MSIELKFILTASMMALLVLSFITIEKTRPLSTTASVWVGFSWLILVAQIFWLWS